MPPRPASASIDPATKPRRVLIATVTAGAGHVQAAAALEEAWRELHPQDVLERVDVLDFTSSLFRKVYAEGYVEIAKRLPELYALLFKKSDNPALLKRLTRFRRTAAKAGTPKFVQHLFEFAPDLVLCTHFLPPEVLGKLATRWKKTPPRVVTVVTDFEAHALWVEPAVDLYAVAAAATKARLVARGLPSEKVIVTGIPISRRFGRSIDASAARLKLGLRDDVPILLVLGGGFGMGPVREILHELGRFEFPVQVVVVCGRNDALRRRLAVMDHRHPTHVLGFVTNMQELMAVSSLIITKPGGLTSSEALALGKPLVILNPLPGQEEANSDFLLEQGAAAKANRVEDLPFKLGQLLGTPKLAEMSVAARRLGHPEAAAAICASVDQRWNEWNAAK